MTVRELMSLGEKQLTERGISDAARDSKSLYCYLIGIPEGKLFMEYKYTIQDLLCEQYFDLVDRRASGEPLQYIIGTQEFMGLTFKVDSRVLIPRMDTEVLVENALSIIKRGALANGERVASPRESWNVLDLCTGSGAIGISIAKLAGEIESGGQQISRRAKRDKADKAKSIAKNINVVLSDISEDAIAVAKENAKLNGVDDKVKPVSGDLFSPFNKLLRKQRFNMIVSNPPYIEKDVIPTLQKEIFEHEPLQALDGGEDGLDFYRRIAEDAPSHLEDGGVILLEIGDTQAEQVMELMESVGSETGRFTAIKTIKDLAGRDRVVFGLYAKAK